MGGGGGSTRLSMLDMLRLLTGDSGSTLGQKIRLLVAAGGSKVVLGVGGDREAGIGTLLDAAVPPGGRAARLIAPLSPCVCTRNEYIV